MKESEKENYAEVLKAVQAAYEAGYDEAYDKYAPKEESEAWRDNYDLYLKDVTDAYNSLTEDDEWIRRKEEEQPRVDIRLTLRKVFLDYWGTQAGWQYRRKKKGSIDWKNTFAHSINQKWNIVWKPYNAPSTQINPTLNNFSKNNKNTGSLQ